MRHICSDSTVAGLVKLYNRYESYAGLCVALKLPTSKRPTLRLMMQRQPGGCSVEFENEVRARLGLKPVKPRRDYHKEKRGTITVSADAKRHLDKARELAGGATWEEFMFTLLRTLAEKEDGTADDDYSSWGEAE